MASLAAPILAASTNRDGWITPQEQLERLAFTVAEDRFRANQAKFEKLPMILNDKVTECAAKSILRCSNLLSYDAQEQVPTLTHLIVDHLIEPTPLPPGLTNWYTARERLRALPEKLPPLPKDIHQIVNSKCPIYDGQIKADGTHYSVDDTHFLQLLCEEDGSLNHFENNVVKPYGENHYLQGVNPLQFRYFWHEARQEHGEVPCELTHWELTTKNILPESRNKSWAEQDELVSSLGQKAFVNYEVPSVKNTPRALFLHRVATGESLYTASDARNGHLYTYTLLRESTEIYRLVVGGFDHAGLSVDDGYDFGDGSVGVGGLRKF